jgi:hypothetical protein
MNPLTASGGPVPLVAGISAVFAVAALVAGLFAVWWTRAMVNAAETRAKAAAAQTEAAMHQWGQTIDSLSAQVRDMPQQGLPAAGPSPPRAGLNLSKRSQVLRMHRRGDSPDQIAIALEVPLQEVDLLLKVQRIILRNL